MGKQKRTFLQALGFGKEKEHRSLEETYTPFLGSGSLMFGNIFNSQYSGLNLPIAYRCINLIADTIASMDLLVKKRQAKGKTTVVKNHPINNLFTDRNARLDKFTFFKLLIQSVIVKGNGFAYIKRDGQGVPIKLIFLESGDVTVTYQKETDTLYYQVAFINGGRRIMPSDMLHFKMFSYNGINGISLLSMARRTVGIAGATDEQVKDFFENGTAVSGIIKATNQLSAKQRQEILQAWNTTYSNGGKGIAVLQGNLDYQPIALNSKDAQMVEARQENNRDLSIFFGVPSELVNAAGTNRSNIEETMNYFATVTLLPYIKMLENELCKKLLTDQETNLKVVFDIESILRANKQTLSTYYSTMTSNGIMTVNEVRQMIGLAEKEGGDDLLLPYSDVAQNTIGKQNQDTDGE